MKKAKTTTKPVDSDVDIKNAIHDELSELIESQSGEGLLDLLRTLKAIRQGKRGLEREIKQVPTRGAKTFAYMRVSTKEQTFKMQKAELKQQNIDLPESDYFTDKISGAVSDRIGWNQLIKNLQRGDTVVSYALDRIGRKTVDVLDKIRFLLDNGINVKIIAFPFPLEADNAFSDIFIAIFAAIAEFERKRIRDRSAAGLKEYLENGGKMGPKPFNKAIRQQVANLYLSGVPVVKIRQIIKQDHDVLLSKKTVYRMVDEAELTEEDKKAVIEAQKAYKKGGKTALTLDGGSLSPEEKEILYNK